MSPGRILGSWWLDPPLAAALLLSAALYLVAARRCARPWPRARSLAFLAGLGAVAVALQSGLDGYAGRQLSIHMVEHLVLILLAAPLLLAGRPLTLALRVLPRDPRRGLALLLHGRAGRVLASPVTGLTAWAVATIATHLTPLYALALTDPLVHLGEHMLYLLCGLLFWAVLIAPGPSPRRLEGVWQVVYLLVSMPLMSAVGVILATDAAPRYAAYLAPARRLGISALGDQRLAGTLMWLAGTLVMGLIALSLAWRSMVGEERRALAGEARADRLSAAARLDTPGAGRA